MNERTKEEIKKMEDAGIDVVMTEGGRLSHVTGGINTDSNVCDSCNCLFFADDPDPFDWFRSGDQKAVCSEMKAVIADSLERPSEMINLSKPLWCPKLERELTKKEKNIAETRLAFDKKRF